MPAASSRSRRWPSSPSAPRPIPRRSSGWLVEQFLQDYRPPRQRDRRRKAGRYPARGAGRRRGPRSRGPGQRCPVRRPFPRARQNRLNRPDPRLVRCAGEGRRELDTKGQNWDITIKGKDLSPGLWRAVVSGKTAGGEAVVKVCFLVKGAGAAAPASVSASPPLPTTSSASGRPSDQDTPVTSGKESSAGRRPTGRNSIPRTSGTTSTPMTRSSGSRLMRVMSGRSIRRPGISARTASSMRFPAIGRPARRPVRRFFGSPTGQARPPPHPQPGPVHLLAGGSGKHTYYLSHS